MQRQHAAYFRSSARAMPGNAIAYPRAEEGGHVVPLYREALMGTVTGSVVPQIARRRLPQPRPEDTKALGDGYSAQVHRFVRMLLDGDEDGCIVMVRRHLARSRDPQRLADQMLGPSSRLLGELWRTDDCDFLDVTVAMLGIQRMFRRAQEDCPYPLPVSPARTILLAPVADEHHGFGLAVVEDAFRRQGWWVEVFGPDEGDMLLSRARADVHSAVGLSVGGVTMVPVLARTIAALRRIAGARHVPILVGGALFVEKPSLAFDVGADFLALDAASAVGWADKTVAACANGAHMSAESD